MVVMVVGGNGQLGSACCAELLRRGVRVRPSVREARRGTSLQQAGVEVVELDLTSGSDAEAAGVRRIVLPSVPLAAADDAAPLVRGRRELEQRILSSGMQSWVLRLPPFMDVWLGLACVEAALRPDTAPRPVEVGGPEVLSWDDVAAVYVDVLGRRARVVTTPAVVFAAAARVLAPVASFLRAKAALPDRSGG